MIRPRARQRTLIGVSLLLVPLNLLWFITNTFPFDVIVDWHHQVGLSYSGLILATILALYLVELVTIIGLARIATTLLPRGPADRRGIAPATATSRPDPDLLWLAHHDVYARVLRLPRTGGKGHETNRGHEPRLDSGFYVGVPGGFAGMFDTAQGSVFFLDQQRIALDGSVRCQVLPGRRRSVFQIWREDQLEVELSYAAPADVDIGDSFSSRYDRDFFVWLTESHGAGMLQTSRTRDLTAETP